MIPEQEETEITLGNGRLLGLFFGLIVLCGVFLVMGYMLGRNSAPGNTMLTDNPSGSSGDTALKPAAIQGVATPTPAPATPVTPSTEPSAAVESEQATAMPAGEPAGHSAQPEMTRPAAPIVGGYIVQVAAVSKQQDADALAAALRRKQYAVFVASHTTDSLFHVQIGPFGDLKQADAVRSRLVADGYNPIVKK